MQVYIYDTSEEFEYGTLKLEAMGRAILDIQVKLYEAKIPMDISKGTAWKEKFYVFVDSD